MQALILASGAGTRLRPLTDSRPKALLEVGGQTILDRQLDSLTRHGVSRVIITTGPFPRMVEEHVRRIHHLPARFVHNPRYASTNYIYTLWLAREHVSNSEVTLLLHGDLVFDPAVVGRLLEATGNRVLVNPDIVPPGKDFKALVENDRVVRIEVNVSGPGAFFCAPLYRFTAAGLRAWMDTIDGFVRQLKTDRYAEDAFNEASDRITLRPHYDTGFCMEIDTPEDLEKAREFFSRS